MRAPVFPTRIATPDVLMSCSHPRLYPLGLDRAARPC